MACLVSEEVRASMLQVEQALSLAEQQQEIPVWIVEQPVTVTPP